MDGRVAVVTGAGQGIGAAIATACAEAGAELVLVDRDQAAVASVAARLDAVPVTADVATSDGAAAVIVAALAGYGRIEVLVNNAAAYRTGALHECDERDWQATLAGVLDPVFRTTRAVLPMMMAAGHGAIVNVASVNQLVAAPHHAAYTAAKAGVAALTRQLAVEYGRYGIRCNSVSPGRIVTRPGDEPGDPLEVEPYPVGRLGRPADVAAAVVFLASDAASFITGVDLPVDGGLTVLHPGAVVSPDLRAAWGRPPLVPGTDQDQDGSQRC